MSVVLISVAFLLVSFAHPSGATTTSVAAAVVVDDGGTSEEAACKSVCRLTAAALGGSDDSAVACKAFARALPYPKMGRMCTRKFIEGHDFACSQLCYRFASGDSDDHIRPWIERLTHSACQDVSGHIPYPAVFNACKRGYSQGLTAASATLSRRSELLGEISEHGDDGDEEAIADGGELSRDGERRKAAHPQSQQLRENAAIRDDDATVAKPIVETNPPLAQKEGVPAVPGAGRQAWAEALGTPLEYVDYSTVAQKRVSDARRRRGSDLHRGPACPVCGG